MKKEPSILEKEASEFLARGDAGWSYSLFKEAGDVYKTEGEHEKAALCLASAAGCWAMKSGERMFHNSALAYKNAAGEAELAGDLEYASLLYRQAAINFERDVEFFNYSDCFYRSRECLRKFLILSLLTPRKIHNISAGGIKISESHGVARRILLCLFLTFSSLVWGHGERPGRTFYTALFLIFLSAFFYTLGTLVKNAVVFKPDFPQALYFSVATVTTVGYGDIAPVGLTRLAAMFEVLCGIFVVPIFIVGLSRKYLRV